MSGESKNPPRCAAGFFFEASLQRRADKESRLADGGDATVVEDV
jgi:hypothetical protein